MDYTDTIKYLYDSTPLFQQVGGAAYKGGLENTRALDAHFGHPHRAYRTLHVAGTNGKGSCAHTLAAILQSAGYRTGLYTSPHLVDFRERIRVDGEPVSKEYVVAFVERERAFFEPLHPSFFELTTAMAFRYFADRKVDVAVIEVGLGGRLDCTNIIRPDLCIITNISLDHTQFLGHTLAAIAAEKAGIIKPGVPVVVGETTPETRPVFVEKARNVGAPVYFAEEEQKVAQEHGKTAGYAAASVKEYPGLVVELQGLCQAKNTRTILAALPLLAAAGYRVDGKAVREGFAHVCELTGLMGRWQRLRQHPAVVCDTGHNVGGIAYIARQLRQQQCRRLHIVFGMAADKDIPAVLALLPREADYYFTRASVKRALPEGELLALAAPFGLQGSCYPDVPAAVQAALQKSLPEDFIFVGGSSFVVADLLARRDALNLH
ncbi:MAG: bifunctional folylpolyglutamate synthase/dihydrofolate synthase [Prevotellaceae bacterium]|nr:bifunctional folylpolyglutamate synthase/dihydrofolate synthase [Prevotellaceae bacterium]